MHRILFCSRCRGMKVGWNSRYVSHCVTCEEWISKSSKLLAVTVLSAVLILGFPSRTTSVFSGRGPEEPINQVFHGPLIAFVDPAVRSIEGFLQRNEVDESQRSRVAESIICSARKYNIDSRLIASIMIVESRANPFAISGRDSIGIMQIHLPTWGQTADREGINLLKIEDNVDFGVRILKDYVRQFGLWEGVKRYKGWIAADPESQHSAEEYLNKVQRVYGYEPPVASTANFLQ
jgi:hypothetical protein